MPLPNNPWIVPHRQTTAARVRLVCFAHAGAGSQVYFGWPRRLPAEIDVWAILPPGHERRLREPLPWQLDALADGAADALRSRLDGPYALFGHSLGALVAFETARRLRDDVGEPVRLFVSGRGGPRLPLSRPPMHRLPEAEFLQRLREFDGMPEAVLRTPELLSLLMPILRADMGAYETYQYTAESPLDCPISAYGGSDDPQVDRNQLEAWQAETTGPFEVRQFSGTHFYLHEQPQPLLRTLCEQLGVGALRTVAERETAQFERPGSLDV